LKVKQKQHGEGSRYLEDVEPEITTVDPQVDEIVVPMFALNVHFYLLIDKER
jgi:hypothetical protein